MNKHVQGVSLAAAYGLISGLILTCLFKWLESVTGEKIYTFLLNVDYIPVIGDISFPEWIEVVFHLIVSIVVTIGFYLMFQLRTTWKRQSLLICTGVSIVIGIALFPTTALSDHTPEITDGLSLLYWLLGHAVFGAVLGLFYRLGK
ncbi:hypothetical protein [Sporosarcina sp. A2]|uniref:hypothetical protein n=1 Tax=Sporosarcina sp. A2 TaxID=3393449 RepID=UPI003D7B3FA0